MGGSSRGPLGAVRNEARILTTACGSARFLVEFGWFCLGLSWLLMGCRIKTSGVVSHGFPACSWLLCALFMLSGQAIRWLFEGIHTFHSQRFPRGQSGRVCHCVHHPDPSSGSHCWPSGPMKTERRWLPQPDVHPFASETLLSMLCSCDDRIVLGCGPTKPRGCF